MRGPNAARRRACGAVGDRDPKLRVHGTRRQRLEVRVHLMLGVADASRHDGWLLRQGLLDPTNTGAGVWADTAYRSQQNETFLARHGFISHIHRRRAPGSAAARTHTPRQCQALARPGSGRARVRGAEANHGTDRPHHRSRPGAHEDRDGQPRLQHPSPGPTPRPGHRLTVRPRGSCA